MFTEVAFQLYLVQRARHVYWKSKMARKPGKNMQWLQTNRCFSHFICSPCFESLPINFFCKQIAIAKSLNANWKISAEKLVKYRSPNLVRSDHLLVSGHLLLRIKGFVGYGLFGGLFHEELYWIPKKMGISILTF